MTSMITIDGNQAVARVAHRLNEVIAIYPITPSSSMGEYADEWSAAGITNLWGGLPKVIEMQSEAGAAGTVHGALQRGALTTTFTSSQGLLLMIPNMYKIAGELTPAVFHVAARSVASHALSIFCDHSDVMACRGTGFGMLASNSVQEAQDFALIAQAASLESCIPMLHFFDGFRTSHEVAKIVPVDDEVMREMIDDRWVQKHRQRALSPDRPAIRGTAQNPDVFFQSREAANLHYQRLPDILAGAMERFAGHTGRSYRLFDYTGAADAESVMVIMGSAAETAHDTVAHLTAQGDKIGLLKVRLFRPMCGERLVEALPRTVKRLAVLDRCKEPGAAGEPLYKDVVTAIAEHVSSGGGRFAGMPRVVGGRYGLSSKEFTPGMIRSVFDALKTDHPPNGFTVGIRDDVTHTSLEWDAGFQTDADLQTRHAIFYGLGSDGTVSANRNTIRIIGEETDWYAQAHFVFDSKKAGAITVSHLRFGDRPIRATYLIGKGEAEFVGCHQAMFIDRHDMLEMAKDGATFLLNVPWPTAEVWDRMPQRMQQQIIDKHLTVYAIDAYSVAKQAGLGKRINTIMQTCYFALADLLPRDEAIEKIKASVRQTYGTKGSRILEANFAAIDQALAHLSEVEPAAAATSTRQQQPSVPGDVPTFVSDVTGRLIAGHGDDIPVSLLPVDGTWPTGTAAYEKRQLALEIPVLEEDLCILCGKCVFVCPHSAIRSKVFSADAIEDAPDGFKAMPVKGKEFDAGLLMTYQVAPQDCTGCTLCVDICPARDKSNLSRKALNMHPIEPVLEREKQ